MSGNSSTPTCAVCAQTTTSSNEPLRRCGRCLSTHYCSPECQKTDWKKHKQTCTQQSTSRSPSAASSSQLPDPLSQGLLRPINQPFCQLKSRTWLYNRPERDVFKLLIDSYRLRMHDDYTLEKKFDADGIYGGARSGLPGFQRFSRRASALGLLPGWWSDRKATECERVGADDHGWSSLQRKVTKGDVLTHYNDQYMPMQLRLFGEQVYGTGPGGQRGAGILQQMVLMERRGSMNHAISIMDMSQSS